VTGSGGGDFLLVALVGVLLAALLIVAGWAGGVLGVGSLTALGVARRRRRRSENH
jgi:hypothetical protein